MPVALKRYLLFMTMGVGALLGLLTLSTLGDPPASATAPNLGDGAGIPPVDSDEYPELGDLGQFWSVFGTSGPIGVVSWGGYLMVKQWREGRTIDVNGYKERAYAAEERCNSADERAREAEKELQVARDKARKAFDIAEADKEKFHDIIIQDRTVYRERYNDIHDKLAIEMRERADREERLDKHNIWYPDTPPPYTGKMIDDLTPEDLHRAEEALSTDTNPMDELDPDDFKKTDPEDEI